MHGTGAKGSLSIRCLGRTEITVFTQHESIVHHNLDGTSNNLLLVEKQVNLPRSHLRKLSHHNVLSNTPENLFLSKHSCIHKHINCFLKTTAQQGSTLHPVDTVSINRHQMAMHGHDIHQTCQMAIIDIGTIETNHIPQLTKNGSSHTLDSQHNEYFYNIVTSGTGRIDIIHRQDAHKIGSICFQNPLLFYSKSFFIIPNRPLDSSTHKDLSDILDTP
mmetsp:Transcript_37156/g.54663  ORF Transcript_37156/g.54663 Transcript_37156/m.54663 type:complete len:218 (-) Transcript_37156:4433-5086(-)